MTIRIKVTNLEPTTLHEPAGVKFVKDKDTEKQVDSFFEAIKFLEKRGFITQSTIDEGQDYLAMTLEFQNEEVMKKLTEQRNKLNRQISSLKKANLKQ